MSIVIVEYSTAISHTHGKLRFKQTPVALSASYCASWVMDDSWPDVGTGKRVTHVESAAFPNCVQYVGPIVEAAQEYLNSAQFIADFSVV